MPRLSPHKVEILRRALEEAHEDFITSGQISQDAQAPARRYRDPRDIELAAFICAVIAYGKIAHVQKSIEKILLPMGDRPAEWLVAASSKALRSLCRGWSHRFNTQDDIEVLLHLLQSVYRNHDSLEALLDPSEEDSSQTLLERLVDRLSGCALPRHLRLPEAGSSFWFFLSRPSSGSACKRLNLFLRWMAGKSEADFGCWSRVATRQLLMPVDTHVHRQSLKLGLTRRKSADWKTAEEITESLRMLDPNDPTRFDFALCHIGVTGQDFSIQKKKRSSVSDDLMIHKKRKV